MSIVATAPPLSSSARLMTADEFYDFVNLPENEERTFELVRGRVIEMSRPTIEHCLVADNVLFEVKQFVRAKLPGCVIGNDAGMIVSEDPDTLRGADVAYFPQFRTTKDIPKKWAETPPLLAVEVLSPDDRPGRVNAKVRDYLDFGIKLIWVIDYLDRIVTVYRPESPLSVFKENDVLTGGDELPGFACPVRILFDADGK